MQICASFSFYIYFYPSQPIQMGPGKIPETTNQLSLALSIRPHWTSLHFIPQKVLYL